MKKSDLVLVTRPEASLVVTLSPNSVAAPRVTPSNGSGSR
jgi:hypothetical protein